MHASLQARQRCAVIAKLTFRRSSCFEMPQLSAAEIAAELGMHEDDPVVHEQLRLQEAAARSARQLGDGDARGTADVFSGRASRRANRVPAPVPATPAPKRKGDTAENPSSAKQDPDRPSAAEDRKASRREVDRSARRSQGGEWSDDDDDAAMPPPPPRRPQAPPPPPQQPFVPPPPPSAPAEASRKTKPMVEDEEATDSSSDLSLDDDQRYDELATTESLSGRSLSDVLRIASALKPLVAAAKKPNLFAETCASLEPLEPLKASAVKLILSVVGVLSDGVVLAVFDGQEEDVAELAELRAEALRADVTCAKEAKARVAEEERQAALASAKAAPKSSKQVVSELELSFEVRDKCSKACVTSKALASRYGTSAGCTCKASNSWSSSMKLVDIKGQKRPILHFDSGEEFIVSSLEALKWRLRPAGGGSGEDALTRVQEAARAARDKAGWKGDVNLASK